MTDLEALAGRIAGEAGAGEQVEVVVGRSRATTVRAYEGAVESYTSAETRGIGVRVIVDQRTGFASAGSLDDDVIAELLADARDNARFAEPDEFAGLAVPDGVAPVALDLWSDDVVRRNDADRIAAAVALEKAVLAADPRMVGVRTAIYGDSASEFAVATSTGIAAASAGTYAYLSTAALARDGDETTVGGAVDAGRNPSALDPEAVAREAADRALRLLGASKVPSQRIGLVLEPRMAATLMGIVAGTLCGDRVAKGRSPFADREGQEIASGLLTLLDDPTDPRSLGAEVCDGEGLATRRNTLIDGGVLHGFLCDSYAGRRLGRPSTASAVRGVRSLPGAGPQALAVAPGSATFADLLATVDKAVLVYSMSGLHSGVNAVSGDFSVGVEGVLVEGGSLGAPVKEVTVASTIQRLLLDIVAVGADLEWLPGGTASPSIVIGEVSLSGT